MERTSISKEHLIDYDFILKQGLAGAAASQKPIS